VFRFASHKAVVPGWVVLTLALGCFAPLLAQEPKIVFVSPRHLSTAIGPTTIELNILGTQGKRIERVELLIDGAAFKTLTSPPWKTQWDAGDGSRGHSVAAQVRLEGGAAARAAVQTSPLRINQVKEVGLVNLYAIVRSKSGAYVTDLGVDDFEIYENGVRQTIARFSADRKPLQVAVALDTSLSMSRGNKLGSARRAALGFLDLLEPQDHGMVVTFADEVHVTQEVTTDRQAMAQAIRSTEAKGGTALYDAVWRSSKKLESFDGRRVLVLLSDGRDEAANGFEPGSLHTRREAQEQALRSEVMVFSIGLGHNLDRKYPSLWERPRDGSGPGDSLQQILFGLAESTGGRALISPGVGRLRKAFRDVADDLRHQYSLAYVSSDSRHDGAWRAIEVRMPVRSALEVVAREGYYAPGASPRQASSR